MASLVAFASRRHLACPADMQPIDRPSILMHLPLPPRLRVDGAAQGIATGADDRRPFIQRTAITLCDNEC